MIEPGTLVDGRYAVEASVGSGGLAEVYRVRHTSLGTLHALKVLTWDRPSVTRRLLLEGRIQAQLKHPNIVAVSDVLSVDGRAALLLEFVDGPTLKEWQRDRGPLPVDEALTLFAGIVAAVARAHDAGVLHRDLKPHNVLLELTEAGWHPKVTDFGLAKVMIDEMAAGSTRTNVTMGTPGYMAPEQVRDAANADERTDVFALGAILHELLTGTEAFADERGDVLVTATIERRPAPLHHLDPHVGAVLAKAMSPDAGQRYRDARALAEALFAEGDPRRLPERSASRGGLDLDESRLTPGPSLRHDRSAPAPAQAPPTLATLTPPHSPPRRGRMLWGSLLLLFIASAAAGWWRATRSAPEVSQIEVPQPAPPQLPQPSPPAPSAAPEVALEAPAPPAPPPQPPPRPAASPAPAPAPTTPDAPAPAPAPAPPPAPPEAPAPSPAPTPAPVVPDAASAAAEREAAVQALTRQLVGTWQGSAQGRPFQVRVLSATPERVTAELVFNPGPAQRTSAVSGRFDDPTLTLADGEISLEALVTGRAMTGSYERGRRAIDFTASR